MMRNWIWLAAATLAAQSPEWTVRLPARVETVTGQAPGRIFYGGQAGTRGVFGELSDRGVEVGPPATAGTLVRALATPPDGRVFFAGQDGPRVIWGIVTENDRQDATATELGDAQVIRLLVDAQGAYYLLGHRGDDVFVWKLGVENGFRVTLGGAGIDRLEDAVVNRDNTLTVLLSTTSAELPAIFGSQTRLSGSPYALSSNGAATFDGALTGFRAPATAWLLPDGNVMYAGTDGQGVQRSRDRGLTWEAVNSGLADPRVTAMVADPGNGQTLYAGTRSGLFRSTNGGANWAAVAVANARDVAALAIPPRDRNQLYVAFRQGGWFRSTDGGRTFTAQSPAGVVSQFLADPNDAAAVFAVQGDDILRAPAGTRHARLEGLREVAVDAANFQNWWALTANAVWRSTDAGRNWTRAASLVGNFSEIVWTGERIVIGGADGLRVQEGDEWRTPDAPAQPVASLAADPSNAGNVYAGLRYRPDLYVARLNASTGAVVASTFVGGMGTESNGRIASLGVEGFLIACETDSGDLLASPEAAQRRLVGATDIYLERLNPSFDFVAATFAGGTADDRPVGLGVDAAGFVYVAGQRGNGSFLSVYAATLSARLAEIPLPGTVRAQIVRPLGGAIVAGIEDDGSYVQLYGPLLSARPIANVRNAASLAAGAVAPGSLAVLEGVEAGGVLSSAVVRFGDWPATVLQAGENRLEVVVPEGVPPGATARIQAITRLGSYEGEVRVENVVPGVFSANRDGRGVALGLLIRIDSDGSQTVEPVYECGANGCVAVPIDLGDPDDQLFLLLRGTGWRLASEWTATIAGRAAEVVESKALDNGIDQVIVRMPPNLAGLGEIPVQFTAGGRNANVVTLLIGSAVQPQ